MLQRHPIEMTLNYDSWLQLMFQLALFRRTDVIKEFTTKKSVKLGKLLKESGVLPADKGSSNKLDQTQTEKDGNEAGSSSSSSSSSSSRRSGSSRRGGRHHGGGGHWKPALQTISEV
ncbi:uncharacterized protein LOC110685752 isoform X2 [Chenopodium quinoa]|uniref:uncharacterized protein LOC110685752 isoform X2 n=1 Tax=Chenopodium quinoa TaxID=63459 RepID=UPI000B77DCE2|nr:uncharacterized protein LOC110685752 isoform X2 [Chenopodium quinoa]